MALTKDLILDEKGLTLPGGYYRAGRIQQDTQRVAHRNLLVEIDAYPSEEAYRNGAFPLATREYIIAGEEFDTLYQRHLKGENLIALAYEAVKKRVDTQTESLFPNPKDQPAPFFADAQDDL